jgi:hypothetical protein
VSFDLKHDIKGATQRICCGEGVVLDLGQQCDRDVVTSIGGEGKIAHSGRQRFSTTAFGGEMNLESKETCVGLGFRIDRHLGVLRDLWAVTEFERFLEHRCKFTSLRVL